MNRGRKVFKFIIVFILLLTAFMYLNNSSLFVQEEEGEPLLLAHRGLAQTFPMEGITGETCTAEVIDDPEHLYLENTIPSMEAAFDEGADIVEVDIHPTTDGEFAVFHDWTLDCRTDGTGTTRDHSMEELKALDVGYGYTADNGETYPFRGEGIGLMPTLNEVLTSFPNKEFLIHIKSNDPAEGEQLAAYLSGYSEERLDDLSVYGGDEPVQALKETMPELRVMSKQTLKSCLLSYEAISWTGYIPEVCKNTQIHLPEQYASYIWGFPGKFINRMDSVNTRVILVAGDGEWSEGFDQPSDIQRIPDGYHGGIWTNRIDRIVPVINE